MGKVKAPIVEGQEYILIEDYGDYKAGDYFVGEKRGLLRHVRTRKVLVAGERIMKHFETTGRRFDYDLNDARNEAAERAKNFIEQYQMDKKIESVILSDQQLYDRIGRTLERKKRQLIIRAVCLLIRFVIEVAVIVAIIWLVYKQCKG